MDWDAAARRHDPATLEGRTFGWFQRLIETRRGLQALHAAAPAEPWWSGNDRVLAYRRHHPRSGPFLALVNVAATSEAVPRSLLGHAGVDVDDLALASDPPPVAAGDDLLLAPLSFAWFAS
jgi:amylosucrase